MGCWAETCEITNVPIDGAEQCVMIDFNGVGPAFDLATSVSTQNWRCLTRIVKGTYSEYGDLIEYPDEEYPGVEKPPSSECYLMRPTFIRGDGLIPVSLRSFIKKSVWDAVVTSTDLPEFSVFSLGSVAFDKVVAAYNENAAFLASSDERLAAIPDSDKNARAVHLLEDIRIRNIQHDLSKIYPGHVEYGAEFVKIVHFMIESRLCFVGSLYGGYQHYGEEAQTLRLNLIQTELKNLLDRNAEFED